MAMRPRPLLCQSRTRRTVCRCPSKWDVGRRGGSPRHPVDGSQGSVFAVEEEYGRGFDGGASGGPFTTTATSSRQLGNVGPSLSGQERPTLPPCHRLQHPTGGCMGPVARPGSMSTSQQQDHAGVSTHGVRGQLAIGQVFSTLRQGIPQSPPPNFPRFPLIPPRFPPFPPASPGSGGESGNAGAVGSRARNGLDTGRSTR